MKTVHIHARNASALVLSVSVIVLSFLLSAPTHWAHLRGLVLASPADEAISFLASSRM